MITKHRTLQPATRRFIWLLLALAAAGLIVVALIATNSNDTATTPPTVITLPPQPARDPGTTVQPTDTTQPPPAAPTSTAAPTTSTTVSVTTTTVTFPDDPEDPSHSELVEQALATRAAIEQARERAAERALLHDATTHDHEPPTEPAATDAPEPAPVPEPPPTTTLEPTPEPPPPPTTEPAPEPAPPPEPEPVLKPLPPKPEDTCSGGRTLESYQREDYSTWYCRAVIPEPVGEPRAWPLPPDPDHYTYRNSDPDNVPGDAMTYPIELEVGNMFYGSTGIRGIIVDIVPRPDRDLWGWDWYRVYECIEAPTLSDSWEYGFWAIREPDGRFRIEWNNSRWVVPCGYEPDA